MPIEGVPECQLKASQNGKSSHQNWMFVDRRGGEIGVRILDFFADFI